LPQVGTTSLVGSRVGGLRSRRGDGLGRGGRRVRDLGRRRPGERHVPRYEPDRDRHERGSDDDDRPDPCLVGPTRGAPRGPHRPRHRPLEPPPVPTRRHPRHQCGRAPARREENLLAGSLTPVAIAGTVTAHLPRSTSRRCSTKEDDAMRRLSATLILMLLLVIAATPVLAAEGQMTWAVHISLAPTWFDPAETPGIVTPFMILYALHDAIVKPMPGKTMAPSLAESWMVSSDGLTYDFTLRSGVKFHNGVPVTADDVKFSFDRYKGAGNKALKDKVRAVQIVDPLRVRFTLKEPWPDFMAFYGSPATGAGWIVPRKYVEKVGDEGFKKAPVGAGPYRFVSFTPGVELVMEAFDQYWRKPPSVKRLVFKTVTEESTRLAMLKRGEVDIAYSIRGALAEELQRTPGLTLKPTIVHGTQWMNFVDQWDPKSPWADKRVRMAANYAIDRKSINQAETLGFSRIT